MLPTECLLNTVSLQIISKQHMGDTSDEIVDRKAQLIIGCKSIVSARAKISAKYAATNSVPALSSGTKCGALCVFKRVAAK